MHARTTSCHAGTSRMMYMASLGLQVLPGMGPGRPHSALQMYVTDFDLVSKSGALNLT